MIELISPERCTACNICVNACPTNVFEAVAGAPPRIARQDDCQTCFICEAHCPADALYVSPLRDPHPGLDEAALIESGVMGSYRARLGWGEGRTPPRTEADAFVLAGLTPPGPEPGP